jgi:hypothetical protein
MISNLTQEIRISRHLPISKEHEELSLRSFRYTDSSGTAP